MEGLLFHPGEMLREEFMQPQGISARGLARAIGVPATRILEIIHERRGLTAEMCVRLAAFFGTSERFWMNLENDYELACVHKKMQASDEHIVPLKHRTAVA